MVEKLKLDYGISVEWRAFELHPETPPEGRRRRPESSGRFEAVRERLRARAHEGGMAMVSPEVIPNSRRALEASEYARSQGKHEEFHRIVFRKYYGEGQDIGQWDVLRAAAQEVGLDPERMQDQTAAGAFRAAVEAQTAEAAALGITGVPAYIFDGKYAVIGAQDYEVFEQVMARLAYLEQRGHVKD